MFYKTNLVLLVGLTEFQDFSPRKVTIWTTSRHLKLSISFPFDFIINEAKTNKVRMVIVESFHLHIYSTGDKKHLPTFDIIDISLGKLALSDNCEKNMSMLYFFSR